MERLPRTPPPPTGDMPPADFRRWGHHVIDRAARYLAEVETYPVFPQVEPGQIASTLAAGPPPGPEDFADVLADFDRLIIPGVTHWNHPCFFGYFGMTGSGPGILAETLISTLNLNAMLWRTSPAATELEERSTDWLRQALGLPGGFQGHIQDTASVSTLVALAGAREAACPGTREKGLFGAESPLVVYRSEQAHSSIDKAAITLGVGLDHVRPIRADQEFRLEPDALEEAIREDLRAGRRPMAVVATFGTTSTTSVDPIAPIARICRTHGVWLHVDAAYGGAAGVVPEKRHFLDGIEGADSVVLNPHKWLFVPADCSVLFLREPERVKNAFSVVPEYLRTAEAGTVTNLMDYGPALGRRFRALKLWMVLRYFGESGLRSRIAEHIRLAGRLAEWIDAAPDWERLAPVPFSTVCFRYHPESTSESDLDALNERILDAVNASGRAFLSHTSLNGRYTLRMAIGNIKTTEEHVARTWHLLREIVQGSRSAGLDSLT